jgi:ssDNA-binding Zn-finger/Zn-ribbon topoisomerase 1
MEIEYAYLSKPQIQYKAPINRDISKYHEALVIGYDEFENKINREAKERAESYKEKKRIWDAKLCVCGKKLRLVEYSYGEFWGCPDYQNGKTHITLPTQFYGHYIGQLVSRDWVTDIIKELGLKGKVKAKEAFEYYQSIGFEDLRVKHGRGSTEELINSLVKTNKRSKEQEWYSALYLETIYPTVICQQTIVYKLKGQEQKFCIPDFICGSDFEVMIADAKLDYVDIEQLDLYTSLVKFMMDKKKDERPVNGMFLMYEYSNFQPKSKYPVVILKPWELEGWEQNPYR